MQRKILPETAARKRRSVVVAPLLPGRPHCARNCWAQYAERIQHTQPAVPKMDPSAHAAQRVPPLMDAHSPALLRESQASGKSSNSRASDLDRPFHLSQPVARVARVNGTAGPLIEASAWEVG